MNTTKGHVSNEEGETDMHRADHPDYIRTVEKDIIGILESKDVTEITMSKRSKCETWLYIIISIIVGTIIYIQTTIIWVVIMLTTICFWLFYILKRNTHKYRLEITFSSGKPFILESRDKEFLLKIKQMAIQAKINR